MHFSLKLSPAQGGRQHRCAGMARSRVPLVPRRPTAAISSPDLVGPGCTSRPRGDVGPGRAFSSHRLRVNLGPLALFSFPLSNPSLFSIYLASPPLRYALPPRIILPLRRTRDHLAHGDSRRLHHLHHHGLHHLRQPCDPSADRHAPRRRHHRDLPVRRLRQHPDGRARATTRWRSRRAWA